MKTQQIFLLLDLFLKSHKPLGTQNPHTNMDFSMYTKLSLSCLSSSSNYYLINYCPIQHPITTFNATATLVHQAQPKHSHTFESIIVKGVDVEMMEMKRVDVERRAQLLLVQSADIETLLISGAFLITLTEEKKKSVFLRLL